MKLNKFEIIGYIILVLLVTIIFIIGLGTILNLNRIVGTILILALSILYIVCYEEVQKYKYVKREDYNELHQKYIDLILECNKEKKNR